ncbi:hypothetical protein [Thiocystis violascens]|uniref:Uncharacterized protein n=1 Tax=Thiocystis violascens (strain ATCC 17096 / DSM 198 / 6111) TaxID=765911 RepID=I3Y7R4_THIV6|nr:hypothetical protein [Thiocystis violascens]AFL73032.1 hypothetical protein Thivi_1001 [Thiocystis violascens DSM 198]
MKVETVNQLAQVLGDCEPHGPDTEFKTVRDVVAALVDLGNTDKVIARHDDHLGLMIDLSDKFLDSSLNDVANPEFETESEAVLEQANIILPLADRELTEEDLDEIEEDRISRRENDRDD